MKKIYVMSKGQIQEQIVNNYCVINYFDKDMDSLMKVQKLAIAKNTSIIEQFNRNKILEIEANDLEITKETIKLEKKKRKEYPIKLFNKFLAKKIITFVEKNKDMNFIFQCDYGRSRSLTTAYFMNRYILTDHKLINKEILIRNKSIFKILMRAYLFPKK